MNGVMRRRTAAGSAVFLMMYMLAVVLIAPSAARAEPQDNPVFPTTTCGGEWHWIHNQLAEGVESGTLTVVFQKRGVVEVDSTFNGSVLHYNLVLEAGDTLISASDDVEGGKLVLSHWPNCQGTTTTAPPTTAPPTTAPPTTAPPTTPPPTTGNPTPASVSPEVSVLGTVLESSTTVAAVSASTLPFTGFELENTLLLAVAALMSGVGLLLLTVGNEKETATPVHDRW